MPFPPGPLGYPRGFFNVTAPKWCRHKDEFVITEEGVGYVKMTCINCGAVAEKETRQATHDELMRIEKVATVTEVPAP